MELTRELVLSSYDYADGVFTLKRGNRWAKRGSVAGRVARNGYYEIHVKSRWVLAHRLVWLMEYGEWPSTSIDHKDSNKLNNKPENLRLASASQQGFNKGIQSNNTSGFKGVSRASDSTWRARVYEDGKERVLGYFPTPEQANAVCVAARQKLHGEFFKEL